MDVSQQIVNKWAIQTGAAVENYRWWKKLTSFHILSFYIFSQMSYE